MSKAKTAIPEDKDLQVNADEPVKKSKAKRFWEYVTDYKRSTVALTLPSAVFDIVYSSFLFSMAVIFLSFWLFVMARCWTTNISSCLL